MIKYFYKIVEVFIDFSKSKVTNFFKDMFFKSDVKPGKKNFWCKIGIGGCFVKDTPVLMASNPLINTTAAYAMAALPIVSIPIQDVQLFDYAVAHKSVNSSYGLEANNVETFIIGKDPYTSDQQRSRDQYEIDDKNWNEVTFEQVLGSSKCKLALHNDYNRLVSDEGRKSSDTKSLDKEGTATNWIAASTNSLKVGDIHYMNLPEQGISGPFKITSIRHITPQKKPIDEDSTDDYEYRPVTGLFLHESNDVWKLRFDDGSELGVTNNHPIFSVSKGDWQHAGHLEIGEEVLAKSGNTKVVSKERDQTLQPVYNLEIKELHNFLVGDVGVVVHNNYNYNWSKKLDYFEDGVPTGPKLPLEHIWDRHSHTKRQSGVSYFRQKYDSRDKIKNLIENVTKNVEVGDIKKINYSGQNVDWIIVDCRKILSGQNDFIGTDKFGIETKYLKVVIDHIDEHGKIIPKTAFPIDFTP